MDCSFEGLGDAVDALVSDICEPPAIKGRKAHFHFSLPCVCMENIGHMPLTTASPTAAPTAVAADPADLKRTAKKRSQFHGSGNETVAVNASSSGVDSDYPTISPTSTPTWTPLEMATNELKCNQDIFEDYESQGQSDSWENGLEFDDEGFSTFLGRLGSGHPAVTKTFHVPEVAEYLEVSFDFYDIDGMPSADQILFGVQDSYLDLQLFTSNGQKKYYNDIEVTRDTKSNRQISFRVSELDTIYSVKMKIPKYWYRDYDYMLPIGFRVVTTEAISTESYGVDNFRMHAVCLEERVLAAAEPDTNGDDGSFYCSANDFPCEGGDEMVYVCHYSARLGYQTFCVPEADSEVLRFYKNDYCGPCVGGFAARG